MANTDFQNSDTAMDGGDIPVVNTSGAAFPPAGVTQPSCGTAVMLDSANLPGASQASDCVTLATASGGAQLGGFGVVIASCPSLGQAACRLYGIALVQADGAITVGTRVRQSDTTGKLGRVKACAAGEAQMGIAMDTVADGDPIRIRMAPSFNA